MVDLDQALSAGTLVCLVLTFAMVVASERELSIAAAGFTATGGLAVLARAWAKYDRSLCEDDERREWNTHRE